MSFPSSLPGGRAWTPIVTGFLLGMFAGALIVDLGLTSMLKLDSPTGAILVAGVAGAVVSAFGRSQVLLVVDCVALAAYVLIGFTPLVAGATRMWVRSDAMPAKPLDAVIVLSSSVKSDSVLDAVATERLLSGLTLERTMHVPRLITTRIHARIGGRRVSSDGGQQWLVQLAGAPPEWHVVDSVFTTRDEALRSRQLLGAASIVAVVTSPLHTRRACATFEAVGFTVTCVPSREIDYVGRNPETAEDRLKAFRAYVYERLGWLKYRWKGWVKG